MSIFSIKQSKIKLIVILLIVAFIAAPFVFSVAQSLEELNMDADEKRQEIDDLDNKMRTIEDEIEKRRSEAASLNNQLEIIDNEILKAETKIQQTETKIILSKKCVIFTQHQGMGQHFVHVLHRNDFNLLQYADRDVSQILFIMLRNDDLFNPSPVRCQDLFFDSANRQNMSS